MEDLLFSYVGTFQKPRCQWKNVSAKQILVVQFEQLLDMKCLLTVRLILRALR